MGATAELRSGWRVLLSAMLGVGLGFPTVPFYTIGIFAPILAQKFGWSFASIFGGLALTPAALLMGGPLVGYLVDRYGPRRIAVISLAGVGVCYITFAFSSGSITQYYASWVALTLIGMGSTPIPFTRAVNGVFVRRRGLALGITMAGVGLFAFAVKPLGGWALNAAGWRGAIVIIGLLPLLLGAPIVLWGFSSASAGANRSGIEVGRPEAPVGGLTMREALRTRAFWTISLAFIPISFAGGAPLPNMENILRSLRIDQGDVVELTSLIGVTLIAGRLIGGWLIDRIWAPLVAAVVLTAAAAACWMFSQQTLGYQQAMLAIVLLGFAGGVEVDLLSYLVARYIGVRNYGVVYGAIFGLFSIGVGVGPTLLGHAYDRAGSYSLIMRIAAFLLVFAACLLISLGRYPDRMEENWIGKK
jgi:MFS family permease